MITQHPEEDFESETLDLANYCAVIAVKTPVQDGDLILDVNLPYDDLPLMLDIIDALGELTQAVSVKVIRDGISKVLGDEDD